MNCTGTEVGNRHLGNPGKLFQYITFLWNETCIFLFKTFKKKIKNQITGFPLYRKNYLTCYGQNKNTKNTSKSFQFPLVFRTISSSTKYSFDISALKVLTVNPWHSASALPITSGADCGCSKSGSYLLGGGTCYPWVFQVTLFNKIQVFQAGVELPFFLFVICKKAVTRSKWCGADGNKVNRIYKARKRVKKWDTEMIPEFRLNLVHFF